MKDNLAKMDQIAVADSKTARSKVHDFVELTKPRISVMVLLTVATAAILGSASLPLNLWLVLHVMIGVALVSASGSAMNQYLERYTDFLMRRTRKRPLPQQRLTAAEVAWFGAITLGVGLGYLLTKVNIEAAILGLATWVLYVCIYTPLKTRTWTNTIVGAVAGAMPILIGGIALNGSIDQQVWLFFAILFLWQFPHFMAIAWLYRQEYRDGGIVMLPVIDRNGFWTGAQAVVTASALIPFTLLPALTSGGDSAPVVRGIIGIVMFGLGILYLRSSIRFARSLNDVTARALLRISIIHLPIVMTLLLVQKFAMFS